MKIAYFDCFFGISGDMTLGAFLDAGLRFDILEGELKKLKIAGFKIKASKLKRGSLSGTKFDCIVDRKPHSHRQLKEILSIIDKSFLNQRVKAIARAIFTNIGDAEAKIHDEKAAVSVRLHELGQIDSIVDIVGAAIAIDELGIDEVYSSSINVGRAFVKSSHGVLPIPAPATLELLRDIPLRISEEIKEETVTPTGAGILKTLSKGFGPMPEMKIANIGYGAGSHDTHGAPNMLRVLIGEGQPAKKIYEQVKSAVKIFALLVTCNLLLVTSCALADTIYTKDGKELKGIVVEDYKDRITFSTADGEKTLMKSDVKELLYDSEEDNMIKLAELALNRRDYSSSFGYYEMALKLNPDSKTAKDGVVFLQGYLFRKEQAEKEEEIKRRQEFERQGVPLEAEKTESQEFKESIEKLKSSMGMTLVMKKGIPTAENITKNSSAYEAGVRQGDRLVAVWGKLTGYMPLKEIINLLLEKSSMEIKCTIERQVEVRSGSDIGASFSMEFDGLTISDVKKDGPAFEAGLNKDDIIVAIDGNATRYMPLKNAMELIKGSKGGPLQLTFRREFLIWRRE